MSLVRLGVLGCSAEVVLLSLCIMCLAVSYISDIIVLSLCKNSCSARTECVTYFFHLFNTFACPDGHKSLDLFSVLLRKLGGN